MPDVHVSWKPIPARITSRRSRLTSIEIGQF